MSENTAQSTKSHDFLLRRLHSLLGIVPVGVFLIFHLTTNVMVVFNTPEKDQFQAKVDMIHALGPLLVPVEIFGILLPLAFHAGLGVKIWLEGKSNVSQYRYGGNIRYTLQRVTGIIALVFILVHLWQMHWVGAPLGGHHFDADQASVTTARALQATQAWASPLYAIGIVSAAYHFANGIWTSLITWGITIGPTVQRKAGYVCAVLGIALAATGLAAMNGFMTYPLPADDETTPQQAAPEEANPPDDGHAGNTLFDSPVA